MPSVKSFSNIASGHEIPHHKNPEPPIELHGKQDDSLVLAAAHVSKANIKLEKDLLATLGSRMHHSVMLNHADVDSLTSSNEANRKLTKKALTLDNIER